MMLEKMTSHALTARIGELLKTERETIVELLFHLIEVERRGLHLELGHSSMFAFCTDRLKLAKSSTYRRLTSARLLARFPIIGDYLRDGRLSVRTLAELKDVLDEQNHRQVLERAAGRT